MFTVPTQVAELQKLSVDNLVKVANVQLDTAKSLVELNLSAARDIVEEGVKNVRTFAGVKDPKELLELQAAAAKPVAGKTVAYARSVYDVYAKANAELKEIASAQKNAPAGSEAFVAFVKSSVSSAATAFDQVAKIGKQAYEAAETNVATAFAAIEKPLAA